MNSFDITKIDLKRIIKVFSLLSILLFSLNTFAQPTKLSLVDIFTALRSDKATIQEKNQILEEGVKQRGVTFSLSESLQTELEKAGADQKLIEAIRQKSPITVAIAKLEPTPKGESTPKPRDFAFYQNKGNSSYVLGNYESAIKDYTEAIKLNDKASNIFLSRGLAYYNERQFTSASKDFSKVIELDPEESMAYYNRGNALIELGKFEEALIDYRKATELDPENDLAKNSFEKLQADLKPKQIGADQETSNNVNLEKPAKDTITNTPVNVGSLQSLAKKLVSPFYPKFERERGIEGVVTVKVVIDEKGKVISATAINGPKGLRKVSENAAKRSRFTPYLIDNLPQQATGFINYNFKQ